MIPLSAYELDELQQTVRERMDDALLPALTAANRTGELADLLRLLGMGDLVGEDGSADMRPKRVLVIGQTSLKPEKLRSIARKHGFDSNVFDFVLKYEVEHFNFSKLRYSATYRAILTGPMPHSTQGKRDASSAIAEMEAHPEIYPPVIRMTDAHGLKITNNSFGDALEVLASITI